MGFDIPDTYIHRTKKNGHQGEQCIIAGTDPATLHEKVEATIKQFPHLDMEDLKIKMTKDVGVWITYVKESDTIKILTFLEDGQLVVLQYILLVNKEQKKYIC